MKGAKGGKRDQLISNHFKEFNQEIQKENEKVEEQTQSSFKAKKQKNREDERIYEEKIKTLENEEVLTSPLKDNDLNNNIDVNVSNTEDKEKQEETEKTDITEIVEEEKQDKKEKDETLIIKDVLKKEEQQEIIDEKEEDFNNGKEVLIKESIEKEKIEEAIVFSHLQKMIREDYYDVKDLEYKIDVISKKMEQEVLKEEIEKLKQELESILKEFTLLKDKYDYLDITKTLTGIHSLNDNYIENLLEEYKKEIESSRDIETLLREIEQTKNYIGIVETLIITENKKSNLEEKLDEKLDAYGIRDKDFEKLEDEVVEVDKVNDEVGKFTKEIESTMKTLEEEIKEAVKISTRTNTFTETVPHFNRILIASLMLATSKMMPKNMIGRMMKASLIAGAINNFSHAVERREHTKITNEVTYTDYSKDILNNIKNIDYVSGMIADATKNITDIREKFNKDFKEYVGLIPEYKTLLGNLDKVEEELREQQYLIDKYNKTMKQQYDKNNAKKYVKTYEENVV